MGFGPMEKRATLSISRVGVLANTTDFLGGNRIVCLAPHRPIVDHGIAKWMDSPPHQAALIGFPIGLNYRALGLQARNACGEVHLGPIHRLGLSSGIVDRLSERFTFARAGMVSIHFAHQIQSYDRVRLVMVVLDFCSTACKASRPHLPSSFSSRWVGHLEDRFHHGAFDGPALRRLGPVARRPRGEITAHCPNSIRIAPSRPLDCPPDLHRRLEPETNSTHNIRNATNDGFRSLLSALSGALLARKWQPRLDQRRLE